MKLLLVPLVFVYLSLKTNTNHGIERINLYELHKYDFLIIRTFKIIQIDNLPLFIKWSKNAIVVKKKIVYIEVESVTHKNTKQLKLLCALIMALHQQFAFFSHSILLPFQMKPTFPTRCSYLSCPIQCMTTPSDDSISNHFTVRRSANFQSSIWHYDYIQSLKSEYLVRFHSLIFL